MKKCNNCGESATLISDVSEAIINLTTLLEEVQRLKNIETERNDLALRVDALEEAIKHLSIEDKVEKYIAEEYLPF